MNDSLVRRAADRLQTIFPQYSRIKAEAVARAALEGEPTEDVFAREEDGEEQICVVIARAAKE